MPTHNGDEKSLLVPLPALLKEARAAAAGKLAEAQAHKLAAATREAAARIARVDQLRLRVSGAIERQLVAAEQRAEAERLGFALSLAEERLLDAQSTAEASEAAAADAEVQMIRTGIYMELESLFGQEEAARFLVLAAHRTALSTEADSGGTKQGSPVPGAKPEVRGSTRSGPPRRPQDARSIRGLDALHESPTAKEVVGPSGKIYASTSLGCCMLQPGHFPRSRCILLVESRLFDPVILLTILANCATMAWESPLDLCCTPKADFLAKSEWVFLTIFTAELVLKISAYGFIGHREAYIHDAWCQLDFVVVSLAWLPLLFPAAGNYSVLRAFRALRPLRALKRVPGMPVLIEWVLSVTPKMGNVLLLCGFLFLVCSIVGMELFKGTLHYRCALPGFVETIGHPVPPLRRSLSELQEPYDSGVLQGAYDSGVLQEPYDTGVACKPTGVADDHPACASFPAGTSCSYFDSNPAHGMTSFDSVGVNLIIFMQMTTFDDWASPMYLLMEAVSPQVSIYFVLIVMITGFFVVNLFLAVIFMQYGAARAQVKLEQAAEEEEEQERLLQEIEATESASERARLLAAGAPRSDGFVTSDVYSADGGDSRGPSERHAAAARSCSDCSQYGPWRHPFRRVAESAWLANASTALVLVNMAVMCMPYEGMSDEYAERLEATASGISWAFILEMAVKLVGLGCAGYWSDGWNCLDGVIVSLSIAEMVLTALFAAGGVKLSFLRMLRMLRVLRILRLMKSWKGLYKIITTFIRALPHLSNLFILVMLMVFMFSLFGTQLFGGIFTRQAGYSLAACPVRAGRLSPRPYSRSLHRRRRTRAAHTLAPRHTRVSGSPLAARRECVASASRMRWPPRLYPCLRQGGVYPDGVRFPNPNHNPNPNPNPNPNTNPNPYPGRRVPRWLAREASLPLRLQHAGDDHGLRAAHRGVDRCARASL